MPLKKGFLRQTITLEDLNLDRRKLIFGALYWLILSFSIYAFLYIVREGLRFATFWWNGEDFLVLSSSENYFYNFFFASLACIFSFTAISNHWLRRPSTLKNVRGYVMVNIFHDKVSFSWYFIWWIGKLGLVFAFCTQMGTFLTFSIYPDFVPVLLLMVILLFLHQWLRIRLLFKNSIIPMMAGTFGIITLVALVFGAINIIPYERINNSILKQTIGYHINQNLPTLKNGYWLGRRSLVSNIYFGYAKTYSDSVPKIMVRDFHVPANEISLEGIHAFILSEMEEVDEYEKYRLKWCLNIDSSVKMKYVKTLKRELRKNYIPIIYYVGIKYTGNSPGRQIGLGQVLQNAESNYEETLDKLEEEVTLNVSIKRHAIWVEDKRINSENLEQFIKSFFKTNGNNGVVLLEVDDRCSFGFYIETYDRIISSVKYLREEWMMENFNEHYLDPEFEEANQSKKNILAREQFPSNILEVN